jgi:hypothetical protein
LAERAGFEHPNPRARTSFQRNAGRKLAFYRLLSIFDGIESDFMKCLIYRSGDQVDLPARRVASA